MQTSLSHFTHFRGDRGRHGTDWLEKHPGAKFRDIGGIADFNNDSRLDIMWRRLGTMGDVYLWLIDGSQPSPKTAGKFVGGIHQDWDVAGACEFDYAGSQHKADLLWWNNVNGDLYLWLIDGSLASPRTASKYTGRTSPQQWIMEAP